MAHEATKHAHLYGTKGRPGLRDLLVDRTKNATVEYAAAPLRVAVKECFFEY